MALSHTALVFAKWMYWIFALAIHLGLCYFLFKTSRAIAGMLWFLVGLLLIYVMYSVYFPAGDADSSWPPYLTACPDYLTILTPGTSACVDYVGLNTQLVRSDPAHPPLPTDSTRVFDASGTIQQKAAKAQQYGLTWEGVTS